MIACWQKTIKKSDDWSAASTCESGGRLGLEEQIRLKLHAQRGSFIQKIEDVQEGKVVKRRETSRENARTTKAQLAG